jgi:hypothetical protein
MKTPMRNLRVCVCVYPVCIVPLDFHPEAVHPYQIAADNTEDGQPEYLDSHELVIEEGQDRARQWNIFVHVPA